MEDGIKGKKAYGKIIIIIVLVAISYSTGAYVGFRNGTAKAQAQAVSPKQNINGSTLSSIPQGEYRIGKDISAGEYKIISDDKSCYFKLSKDSSGNKNSIIDNGAVYGQKYITTQDSQYLEIHFGHLEKVN
ncbi:hypothetical protein E4K67_22405 [Desulfosporosinus fructosivorans]|uniref:Uncharacterized protein n=1 Tax=Desulfosporosinus fructosivorans TaxID=2018669 RepID=A0A4Z0QYL5_9FIRM|nr:hypothetical protein [Desulfosporosinus fructosivorans]TGE35872.1 hypothetical protein E4K67_22405 [Desulfosporosinus fructosivorans]